MNVAIYARKSTDQTGVADEQKSVTRQIEHARAYAVSKGWTVSDAHVYVDDGISGAEFANRPGFVRLMNALKPRPAFQALVMSEVSRLGREQIETAYSLKQLSQAGVRCFSYLEDHELTMDSAIDKFLLSAVNFAAEIEREKARQRTRDALLRKAQQGHVTGGACFGYHNVPIMGADGKRSHVERQIEPAEAAVIRRIFQLAADGYGLRAIAKTLNAEGAPSPRAQRGRVQSWAPTSIREVLHRPLYRGEVVWAQTTKRDPWGQVKAAARPPAEWVRRPAPELRIVSDDEWAAAHRRLTAARTLYMQKTGGQTFGRPAVGNPSKYLLTNLALCRRCGGSLKALSRSHGRTRKMFYGCAGYHDRGKTVCTNGANVPMTDADDIVIEALLDDVLDERMIADAVEEALGLIRTDGHEDRLATIDAELAKINQERERLITAIATGGQLDGLLEALRTRDQRRIDLEADRDHVRATRRVGPSDVGRVRDELGELAESWRRILADDPTHARPIVSSLLKGRVTIAPMTVRGQWTVAGEGTLAGLFGKTVCTGARVPLGTPNRFPRSRFPLT